MADDNSYSIFDLWTEPESAANTNVDPVTGEAYTPIYPFNHVTQTESGHSFEMDDTPTRERIRLQHRSGTFTEMHPNGSVVQKIYGNGYEIIAQDKNVLIKGVCNITIQGDAHIHVQGDKIEKIDGNYELHVGGDLSIVSEQDTEIYAAGDMVVGANPDAFDFGLGGTLTLTTGDHVYIDADLQVDGEFVADKITSTTRVDAILGMSAGLEGFVTELGGVSVGIPLAVPGNVLAAVQMAAPVATFGEVTAGLGAFGTMSAVLMTDTTNTLIFDSHVHPVFKAVTGPPDTPMVGI